MTTSFDPASDQPVAEQGRGPFIVPVAGSAVPAGGSAVGSSCRGPLGDGAVSGPVLSSEEARRQILTSRWIARWMDDLIRIPGTGITLGLDAVLGLIPAAGDAVTTAMAVVIMVDAARLRVPLPVLARMGLNIAVDAALGAIPFVGDLFDIANRANRRNLRLLERVVADRREVREASVAHLIGAVAVVLGTFTILVGALVWSAWLLLRLLF